MKTRLISDKASTLVWGSSGAFAIWLGFPNDLFSFPPAVLVWPVSLCALGVSAASWQSAFLKSWLTTLFGMIAALYWLCMPVAQVGGLPWPMAMLCAIFIAACLAAQGGFFGALVYAFKDYQFWLLVPLLGIVWYLLEYTFALVLGFPWLPLAGALVQWPVFMQAADIFGSYFLGAIWLIAFLLILNPFYSSGHSRFLAAASGCLLASCILWYGSFKIISMQLNSGDSHEISVNAIMVEGNVDQNQKWTLPFQKYSLDLYIHLTDEALADARAKGQEQPLILWPETALPFFYEKNHLLGQELRDAVVSWNCPLLFGAPGIAQNGPEKAVYNRAFLLGPSGQSLGMYDKVHLVPFGEYLPSWLRLGFLEALLQNVGIYQEGTSIQSLDYGPLALGVLICYEGIFPWLAKDRITGGANILVDISNDGWFGLTPAARQHLYLTVLRCIEQNRWLWRATNTGISAVANNRGQIMLQGPVYKEGYLLCHGLLIEDQSLFYYLSSWLPWLCLIAGCALAGLGAANLRLRKNARFE